MKPSILITVRGGAVQSVVANGNLDVHLLDWDVLHGSADKHPDMDADLPAMPPDEILTREAFATRLSAARQIARQSIRSKQSNSDNSLS
jgi:hypothetical protein